MWHLSHGSGLDPYERMYRKRREMNICRINSTNTLLRTVFLFTFTMFVDTIITTPPTTTKPEKNTGLLIM